MEAKQVLQNFFVNDLFEKAIANFDIEKYDTEISIRYEEKRFDDAVIQIYFSGKRKDDFNTTISLNEVSIRRLKDNVEILNAVLSESRTINNNFLNRLNFK